MEGGVLPGLQRLTNGGDNGGCKDHCIRPVPVVEGLVPCDGHTLSCSIRYHLNRESDNEGQGRGHTEDTF